MRAAVLSFFRPTPGGRAAAPAAVLLSFVFLLCSGQALAQARFTLQGTPTVLPKTVLPAQVELQLDLDPAQDSFGGQVALHVRATQRVDAIVLHAAELQAETATLRAANGSAAARTLQVTADESTQTWRLQPTDGKPIAAGAWRIDIRYRGRVQTAGQGLYRANYRVDGQPARLLATQLQALHARRVLPVFDEPVFRTRFALTVRAPEGWQVVSNMPLLGTPAPAAAGQIEHRFATTPTMPSYLLAVTVGQFDVLEDSVEGVPLRILTTRGKREQGRLAMAATKELLPYFRSYFGRAFALPKLDQIAVPGTRIGAMEDWGAISYIEGALLFDPARHSAENERRVYSTVAHEIAHQWFGDLVSVSSWSETWLNESFATWMATKATEHFRPQWNVRLLGRERLDRALARDATAATRAIRSGPISEARIFEAFDGIAYSKGGAVLAMLEQWIGPAAFQRGMAAYMAERAFKPASAGDLWHHMARASGARQLPAVASSWIDQPGLPEVQLAARCEAGQTRVSLRQQRFSAGDAPAGSQQQLWQVPLRLSYGGAERTVLLREAHSGLTLPGCDERVLLGNAGGRGYYHVNYDAALWARLTQTFATLAPEDRVTLVSDSFTLARAGRRTMLDHLALLRALPQVNDASRAALYMQAAAQFEMLDTALHGTPAQAPLRDAAHALLAPELERVGWQPAADEASAVALQRGALVRRLAEMGHAPTIAASKSRLKAALAADAAAVAPTLRSAVIAAVGANADAGEFDTLLAALRSTDSDSERSMLLTALAAGRDPERAARLLDESVSGRLSPSLSASLPGMVGRVPETAPLAYQFVLQHWPQLEKLAGRQVFGSQQWLLPGTVVSANDPAVAQRLLADQARLAGPAGDSTARSVAAGIEGRHRLREREAVALARGLPGWMAN